MPTDDGVRLHDDEHVRKTGPAARKQEPEGAVEVARARTLGVALQHGKLLAEGEVLDHKVSVWPEAGAQRAKSVEKEGEHRVDHARNGREAAPSPWIAHWPLSPTGIQPFGRASGEPAGKKPRANGA
jgi:hypothetical protein